MRHSFLRASVLICFILSFIITAVAQTPRIQKTFRGETEPFGWSLTIDKKERKKADDLGRRTVSLPASPQAERLPDEITVETDLVLNDLLVFDKKGQVISGLRADEFDVREDGEPQTIEVFSNGASYIPRSIFLVIDHSMSQYRYIDKSIEAAKVLVNSLRPGDRMAVVSDDVQMITDLTNDKEKLTQCLNSMKDKTLAGDFGKSRQYSSLYATLRERTERNGTRQIIIFQTDGDEWSVLRSKYFHGDANFEFKDVIEAAEKNGVTVYSVYTGKTMVGVPTKEKIEQVREILREERNAARLKNPAFATPVTIKFQKRALEARAERLEIEELAVADIATKTGGFAQTLDTPEQANEIYTKILSDINRRYVIGYYPTNQIKDGRRRQMSVTVRGRSGLKVWGRTSYVSRYDANAAMRSN